MIWQIVRKEILFHIMTLRFALIHLLILILMVTNAVMYAFIPGYARYPSEIAEYRSRYAQSLSRLEELSHRGLGELAMAGPGEIPMLPRPLMFCAEGNDRLIIPRWVDMGNWYMIYGGEATGQMFRDDYTGREIWCLSYPPSGDKSITSERITIDWIFIGVIISFGAILFAFDTISAERERGTLRLIFSNAVSRAQVLLGKFLGAFLTLMAPLLVGILINLFIIHASGTIPLEKHDWFRLGGMVALLALHISVFILLGMFVSSRVSHSITSLAILLLIWVFLAFLWPNLSGLAVGNLKPIPSIEGISWQRMALLKDINDKFQPYFSAGKLGQPPSPENPEATRQWAEYLTQKVKTESRINDQHLDEQLRQVQLARKVTLVSPVAVYQYAMEALAGTGVEGYISFIKQVRRYRQEFIDFSKYQDRSDPSSLHIYGVKEGLSQRPVGAKSVPKFKERITYGNAFSYIVILLLFNLLFFMAAYISFLRCDVK